MKRLGLIRFSMGITLGFILGELCFDILWNNKNVFHYFFRWHFAIKYLLFFSISLTLFYYLPKKYKDKYLDKYVDSKSIF
jgi:hypothetical protein